MSFSIEFFNLLHASINSSSLAAYDSLIQLGAPKSSPGTREMFVSLFLYDF